MCFKERDMATCTTGGASNANALPGETGYVKPEVPGVPEVPVPEPEPVPESGPVVLKADLQDQARELGLPVSGTKAQLTDALAAAVEPEPAPATASPSPASAAPKPAPAGGGSGGWAADPSVKVTVT
jgi:hypothetical protein